MSKNKERDTMATNYNGMNFDQMGFKKQSDGSYYNPRTGEKYLSNGTVNLTSDNGTGTKVLQSTDTTKETSAPIYTPPPKPAVTQSTPKYDFASQINSIYDPLLSQLASMKEGTLNNIRTAYDNAVSGYNSQIPLQDQYKYNNLNTVDSAYYQNQQGLNAAMEAAGQRGGENITGAIANQTTRGNGVNDVNQTYSNNLAAIAEAVRQTEASRANDITGAENNYAGQVAQLNSQRAAALRDAQNANDPNYLPNAINLANLTGNLNFNGATTPTLNMQQYQTGVSQWNTTNEQQQTQQTWENNFNQGQAATAASQAAATAAYQASRDKVLDSQWLQQFNQSQQKMILDNALNQKKINQDDYANVTARMNANTNSTQATNEANQNAAAVKTKAYNDAVSRISDLYVTKDPYDGSSNINKAGIAAYLKSLYQSNPANKSLVDQLADYYGVSPNDLQ